MKTVIKEIPNANIDFKELMDLHGFNGMIPSHYIINKRIPGIGATKNELLSFRHSIIIAPFTAIIEVKKEQYQSLIFDQYGESELEDAITKILEYLNNDSIEFKKIMTTPESFYKVKRALEIYNTNYINDFFILIDECDVFVSDAIFRKKMLNFLPDFFSFNNLAMISATPHIPTDPRFIEKGFAYLKLEPSFTLNNKLELLITNNINSSTRDIIDFYSKMNKQPFFIFTNCKSTIAYLAKQNNIRDDYRIFCSPTLKDGFFTPQQIDNVHTSIKEQEFANSNMLTGRYFSGVDIFLEDGIKPNVIMISNPAETPHSIIHPNYTALQIFGRCRKGVSSVTHITTLLNDREHSDPKEVEKIIDEEVTLLTKLKEIRDKLPSKANRKLVNDLMQKNKGFDMFNSDGSLNTYFRDNHLYSTLTENIFTSSNALITEYNEGKFFKVKAQTVYKAFTDEDTFKLKSLKKTKAKSIEVFKQLHHLIMEYGLFYGGSDFSNFYNHLHLLQKEDPLIFEAYFVLGAEELAKCRFLRSKIRDLVNAKKHKDKRNNLQMVDEITTSFYLGIKVYVSEIERTLNAIYLRFDYRDNRNKPMKAKGTDIEDYFECKRHNGKKKINGIYESFYILNKAKYRISSDFKR